MLLTDRYRDMVSKSRAWSCSSARKLQARHFLSHMLLRRYLFHLTCFDLLPTIPFTTVQRINLQNPSSQFILSILPIISVRMYFHTIYHSVFFLFVNLCIYVWPC